MIQVFFNALAVGLGIGTLGLGFLLVYRPTGVFHVSAGAIYAAMPFLLLELGTRGAPLWLSLLICVAFGIGISCAIEFFNHRRLGIGLSQTSAHLLSSLGIYIVLTQLVVIVWGPNVRSLRVGQDHSFRLGLLVATRAQILEITIQAVLLLAFAALLKFTNIGLKLRALMQNPSEMALLGYSTQGFRLLAFAISGVFVAVVSLVNAYDLGFDPHGGLPAIILAIAAVIVGGRDSFLGPVAGGLLLGLLRSLAVWFSPKWQDCFTFVLLAACLVFLPNGILGYSRRVKAP